MPEGLRSLSGSIVRGACKKQAKGTRQGAKGKTEDANHHQATEACDVRVFLSGSVSVSQSESNVAMPIIIQDVVHMYPGVQAWAGMKERIRECTRKSISGGCRARR